MWTIPIVMVEDEGRLMPVGTVDDEGRKILEACYGDGNVIKGDRTFGATNHPKIRIVAQSTLDYWNNKFHLSYKLVRVVGATCTLLAPFCIKYLISMETAKSEEDKPTKFFVKTFERFDELRFCICVPWDTYVLRNPKPYCGEWMETVDLTFPSYVNDALEKALPEELVKSLKELGSLKKGSIQVDMEELDLEEIDFERLKQRISFVLEDQISTGKRALDVEGSIIWVDMEELDLEEIDYEGLKQKISLVLKERIITLKDLKEQRALQLRLEQLEKDPEEIARKEEQKKYSRMFAEIREKMKTSVC